MLLEAPHSGATVQCNSLQICGTTKQLRRAFHMLPTTRTDSRVDSGSVPYITRLRHTLLIRKSLDVSIYAVQTAMS
jgi:hypothetical protein